MMRPLSLFVFAGCAAAPFVAAQDPSEAPTSRPTSQPQMTAEKLVAMLDQHGIGLDLEAGTVTIETEVGNPVDPLEYLVIHRKGKTHEALLVTDALPSLINTALLAAGFEAGKNARVVEKDPAPTIEEVRAGAEWLDVFPPEGASMWMTASWEAKGETHVDVPVEQFLLDMTTGKVVRDTRWVFLGGNWAPLLRGEDPVFMGDYQGNLVSSCYMHPPNHLVTIVHERGPDEQNWWLTKYAPETGTEVQVKFWREKPKTVVEREARLAAEAKAAPPADETSPLKDAADPDKKDDPDRR